MLVSRASYTEPTSGVTPDPLALWASAPLCPRYDTRLRATSRTFHAQPFTAPFDDRLSFGEDP